jgi:transposase-like protein
VILRIDQDQKESNAMAADNSVDPAGWLAEQIGACEPDVLRSMVKTMAEALMSAEADALCGAGYGQRSQERVNQRNGYRSRDWDTRAGTVELAIPKLRSGSYFPEWLLEWRRRAEQALVSVVATSYLLGVSTRRVDKLVSRWASSTSPKARSRRCRRSWTPRSRRSATGPWRPARSFQTKNSGKNWGLIQVRPEP